MRVLPGMPAALGFRGVADHATGTRRRQGAGPSGVRGPRWGFGSRVRRTEWRRTRRPSPEERVGEVMFSAGKRCSHGATMPLPVRSTLCAAHSAISVPYEAFLPKNFGTASSRGREPVNRSPACRRPGRTGAVRPQHLLQPPFGSALAAWPSDCLVVVSVSTSARSQRQHPPALETFAPNPAFGLQVVTLLAGCLMADVQRLKR